MKEIIGNIIGFLGIVAGTIQMAKSADEKNWIRFWLGIIIIVLAVALISLSK